MSNIKNLTTIYAIMRKDIEQEYSLHPSRDVVCAFCKTLEGAENMCGEYQQAWEDSGGASEAYYYVVGNIFYDK